MQLATRIGTMSRRGAPLPYLRRVAYLESDGAQIIKFPVISKSNASFELDMQSDYFGIESPLVDVPETQIFVSVGEKMMMRVWNLQDFSKYGSLSFLWNLNWVNGYKVHLDGGFHMIGIGYIDFQGGLHQAVMRVDRKDVLFHAFPTTWDSGLQEFKVYGITFKIRSLSYVVAGEINVNAIPVLDLSGRPAMYDEVNGQFFYNQGAGEFTWGEL